MIDIGLSKLVLIGVVALVVIGPEKLPRVARTVGNLLGRAQRYVNDVKSEVARQMELEELGRMKSEVERTASAVRNSIDQGVSEVTHDLETAYGGAAVHAEPRKTAELAVGSSASGDLAAQDYDGSHRPRRNWRLKRATVPQWYKRRTGVRAHVLSSAARRARRRGKR